MNLFAVLQQNETTSRFPEKVLRWHTLAPGRERDHAVKQALETPDLLADVLVGYTDSNTPLDPAIHLALRNRFLHTESPSDALVRYMICVEPHVLMHQVAFRESWALLGEHTFLELWYVWLLLRKPIPDDWMAFFQARLTTSHVVATITRCHFPLAQCIVFLTQCPQVDLAVLVRKCYSFHELACALRQVFTASEFPFLVRALVGLPNPMRAVEQLRLTCVSDFVQLCDVAGDLAASLTPFWNAAFRSFLFSHATMQRVEGRLPASVRTIQVARELFEPVLLPLVGFSDDTRVDRREYYLLFQHGFAQVTRGDGSIEPCSRAEVLAHFLALFQHEMRDQPFVSARDALGFVPTQDWYALSASWGRESAAFDALKPEERQYVQRFLDFFFGKRVRKMCILPHKLIAATNFVASFVLCALDPHGNEVSFIMGFIASGLFALCALLFAHPFGDTWLHTAAHRIVIYLELTMILVLVIATATHASDSEWLTVVLSFVIAQSLYSWIVSLWWIRAK